MYSFGNNKRRKIKTPSITENDDVDSRGNIKDLIDYDYKEDDDSEEDAENTIKLVFPFLFPNLYKKGGDESESDSEKPEDTKSLKSRVKKLALPDNIKSNLLKMLNKHLDDKRSNWFESLVNIPFGTFSNSCFQPPKSVEPIQSTSGKSVSSKPSNLKRKLTKNRTIPLTVSSSSSSLTVIPQTTDIPLVIGNTTVSQPVVNKLLDKVEIKKFFENAITCLNQNIYGLDNVKEEIIGYIAQFITSNNKPRIIGLHGNAGVGKTEIVRNGLAKTLNKEISCISCGGMKDSSYLVGFDYTYLGSRYGKIVESLISTKQMDPVIFIDELDKISEGSEGKEIENMLIHILDPVQNKDFRDKYFSEIPIDLSNVLFVVAFNDISKISPILLDRIHIIKIDDPDVDTKINICKKHLIPKVLKNYTEFKVDDLVFTDDILKYIIKTYTKHESGVRNLNRCIETVINRLNVLKVLGSDLNDFKFSFNLQIKFPFILDTKTVDTLLKTNDNETNTSYKMMYI